METKYTEIIGKYIAGELAGDDLISFQKKLLSDKQLQQELKLEKELNAIILDDDVANFRKELIAVSEDIKQEKKPKSILEPIKSNQWYLLAASIIIMVGLAGYFYFLQDQSISSEILFAQYYSKYPSEIAERSDDLPSNNLYILGLTEYEEGNFKEASQFLSAYSQTDSLNYSVYLYLGISYLELNDLDKASETFKTIIANNNNLFIEQAKWYLGLTYLKLDELQFRGEIVRLFNSIVEFNGDRANEAKIILGKME